jgi:transposase
VAKKLQRYSYEFKLEAVRLLQESGKTLVEQASELGINHVTLWGWKKKLGERLAENSPLTVRNAKSKLLSKDEEIRQLRRENEVLREERDFLKKATAFFAKESR